MKTHEVVVGETYLCKVGEALAKVTVVAKVTGRETCGRKDRDSFIVRRVGTDINLPKYRTAAALRPCPLPPHDIR